MSLVKKMVFLAAALAPLFITGSIGVNVGPPAASLSVSKRYVNSPPRSRAFSVLTNGSSIPAGGAVWPTAIYWTEVKVGTPPKTFPVAIDSGSGALDISGVNCDGCPTAPPNNQYDHAASSTSNAAFPYIFSNSYQTCDLKDPTAVCTISGKLYKDQVSLAGIGPVEVTVGSIAKQTTNFDQFAEIGGVMGFTGGSQENVFSQLVASAKCDNVWALCMHPGAKSNGTITIGGVDSRLSVNGHVDYVDDVGFGFHSVNVASMVLGSGKTIKVGKSAILDTGTNILLAPSQVMSELKTSMCSSSSSSPLPHCNDLWNNKCVDLTDDQVAAYPPLTMSLDGNLKLEMSSRDYLLRGSPLASSATQYCLGIRDGGSAGGSGFIIGDTTMRNYYLVFHLDEKKIGWGKVNEKMCGSI